MAQGRKKGDVGFCKVSLRELNALLKEDAFVPVSKKFLDALELIRGVQSASVQVNETIEKIENAIESEDNSEEDTVQMTYEKWE